MGSGVSCASASLRTCTCGRRTKDAEVQTEPLDYEAFAQLNPSLNTLKQLLQEKWAVTDRHDTTGRYLF